MKVNLKQLRERARHFLSPQVAAAAGMSFDELKLFITYQHWPSEAVLVALARRMGFR